MNFVLLVIIGYFIGSIPCSYLSMRIFTGRDIRALGTGSATVTAVLMHGGKRPAAVALLAEIAKGGICFLIAHMLVGEHWATLTILVAAVIGCSWSVWLKGNGGQGLTIAVSGLVLFNIFAVLIMAACYLLPVAVAKRHLLGNRLFRYSFPVVLGLWYVSSEYAWAYALAGALLVLPSFIKQWLVGDEVMAARQAESAGHSGGGAL